MKLPQIEVKISGQCSIIRAADKKRKLDSKTVATPAPPRGTAAQPNR